MVHRLGMLKEKRWNGFGSVIEGLAFFLAAESVGYGRASICLGWMAFIGGVFLYR